MATEAKLPKMTQCLVGSALESIKGCNDIHCLSDDLLMEILRRLPNCQSVIHCKCVCKRWAALISHPWFVGQFIDLNFGNGGIHLNDEQQTLGIVMWYKPDRFHQLWKGSESFFRPSIFNARYSSFSPLPFPGDDNASVTLVASCNDLVLYCRHEKDKKYDYYISNAQTRRWVQLPSPPYYYGRILHFGLICDSPFYSRKTVFSVAYHYSVVVIRCTARPSTQFTAHLFSSTNHDDSQWCDCVLSLPKTCTFVGPCSGFCFEGKLYFTCREGIFGFDQNSIKFDDEIRCCFIEWPVGFLLGWHRVGYSQTNLKVSLLGNGGVLRVWVLKDYKTSNWVLEHSVESRDWVSRESWMTKKLEKFSQYSAMIVDVLGFHPSNSDVIYVLVPGYIFSCNLSTKTVELACRIPVAVSESCKHYLKKPYGFPVMFHCWPTPLPRLSQAEPVGH